MVDQDKVGHSFPPFTIEVERGKIHELALAVGDNNTIYHSREAAQAAGYRDVPLFPTIPTTFAFWGNIHKMEQLISLGIDWKRPGGLGIAFGLIVLLQIIGTGEAARRTLRVSKKPGGSAPSA